MPGPAIQPLPASGVDVDMLNDDFPVPFAHFAARLVGTPDEVWTHVLRTRYGNRKLTEKGWYSLIDNHRNTRA